MSRRIRWEWNSLRRYVTLWFVTMIVLELLANGEYCYFWLFFLDINECNNGTSTCHANATCNNTHGSYICECHKGYYGDGKICNCMYLYPLSLSPHLEKITNILIYLWFGKRSYGHTLYIVITRTFQFAQHSQDLEKSFILV